MKKTFSFTHKFHLKYFLIPLFLSLIVACSHIQAFALTENNDTIQDYLNNQIQNIVAISNQQPELAQEWANKALLIAQKNNRINEKAELLRLIGLTWFYKVDYAQSLDFFTKSHNLFLSIGDRQGEASALSNISLVYQIQGFLQEALEMDFKVLEIREQFNNTDKLAGSYNNIATAYVDLGENQKALEYFTEALKISLESNESASLDLYYNNIGSLYFDQNNLDSAFHYFNHSLQYSIPLNHKQMMANSYIYLGEYYMEQSMFQEAKKNFLKGLKLAQEIGIVYEIEWAAKQLHEAYEKTKQYEEAYKMHKLFKQMADSAKNIKTIQQITKIESEQKYQKERELERIVQTNKELENQLELNKQKKSRDIAISLVIALLFFAAVAYWNYVLKRNDNIKLQAQKEEIQKQRDQIEALNKTKDKFLAIIAHDLRNPLGGIHKLSEVIDTNFHHLGPENLKKYIANIRVTSENVYKLLDNLLQWASLQLGSLTVNAQYFNINEIIEENIELLSGMIFQKKITLHFEKQNNCQIKADKKMINTVVLNLLTNSVKFTPEGGTVSIGIKQQNKVCRISISDNGPGISQKDQKKLFDFSHSSEKVGHSKEKGIGLGLVLCKEFTQLNGGDIGVESEPGQGSTFSFTIPV